MYRASLIFTLTLLAAIPDCIAEDVIALSAKQIQTLGITVSALPAKRSGEISGLPAQIVIPGNQTFIISTPLPAMVEQTLVGIGDNVKKGQPLAILQSPALAEAQRGLLQTSVQSRLAHENMVRDESLYKDGIISESRYRTTRGQAMETEAAYAERRQMLKSSGMSDIYISKLQNGGNIDSQLTLTSPIDGVVLEKSASAGQRLDAAVPIYKVAKISPLALEIQAPFTATRDLKPGSAVSIPAYAATGKLTAIGRSLTGSNQTVLLRGVILTGAENLRPGQFVEASISTSDTQRMQREVPNSALSRINSRTLIFVQTDKGFIPTPVTLISQGASSSVISADFKGDEKIATGGVSTLKAGMMGIGGGE